MLLLRVQAGTVYARRRRRAKRRRWKLRQRRRRRRWCHDRQPWGPVPSSKSCGERRCTPVLPSVVLYDSAPVLRHGARSVVVMDDVRLARPAQTRTGVPRGCILHERGAGSANHLPCSRRTRSSNVWGEGPKVWSRCDIRNDICCIAMVTSQGRYACSGEWPRGWCEPADRTQSFGFYLWNLTPAPFIFLRGCRNPGRST